MKLYHQKDLIDALTLHHSPVAKTNDQQNHDQPSQTTASHYHQPWCSQVSHDYCPLVISFMSFICLVSFILIIYLCLRSSVECHPLRKCLRSLRKSVFKKHTPSNASRLSYDRSIIPTTAMDLSTPVNRSFFSYVNNFTHASPSRQGQVWFTDVSKTTRPPPSYEESQTYTVRNIVKPIPVNPSRTIQLKNQANEVAIENSAFENIEPCNVFPAYRCLTLTSSPNNRASLNRLGDLSRQLLAESAVFEVCSDDGGFSRVGSITVQNDEVPPAYDAVFGNVVSQCGEVVGTFEGNQRYISNEYLI